MRRTKNYLNRNFKKERSDDSLSTKKRSELMSKIRSKETKFEQEIVCALKKTTRKKFQTNVASIRGKPDIVFHKYKVCVFLDSDFWHGWYYPKWKHLLKNDFWREKNRKQPKARPKEYFLFKAKRMDCFTFLGTRNQKKPGTSIKRNNPNTAMSVSTNLIASLSSRWCRKIF